MIPGLKPACFVAPSLVISAITSRILATVFVSALLLAGCGAHGEDSSTDNDPDRSDNAAKASEDLHDKAGRGLEGFPGSLREGDRSEEPYERPELAETRDLDAEAVAALLERLSPLVAEPEDETEFALRPGSQPPPRTGAVERGEFPPLQERVPPEVEPVEGPLEVIRFSPEGPVPVAGQISLTFDRPMVAVTAHDDLAEQPPPAELQPDIPGTWRWVGTRTLVFEPEAARLPMATEFAVTVPAGIAAADGAELEEAVGWEFSTPPPELQGVYPSGHSVGLEPLIFADFDQRIDSEALLEVLALVLEGSDADPLEIRLAEADEIAADENVARLVENTEPGRYLVFRPVEPLPRDARLQVRVPAGAPSAEGPVVTEKEQNRDFRTYGPLTVTDQRCGSSRCAPDDRFILTLSEPLAEDLKIGDKVEVDPPIAGLHVEARSRQITIEGLKDGRTTYTVRLASGITDIYGQELEGEPEFRFDVGSHVPRLSIPGGPLVTLDPFHDPVLDIFSTNYRSVTVHIRQVVPANWPEYARARRHGNLRRADTEPDLPGEAVLTERMDLETESDVVTRTRLALSEWLDEGATGHLLVVVEPGESLGPPPPRHSPARLVSWVQATSIGLDALVDPEHLLVWATDLRSGEPLSDVEITLAGQEPVGVTDEGGLARLDLPPDGKERSSDGPSGWIQAQVGDQVAFLPESQHHFYGTSAWRAREKSEEVLWHVFDDRAMYRPGETVHLKGWIRRMERRPDGGLGLIDPDADISYRLSDSRGNEMASGQTGLSRLGGFDFSLEIPDTPNLGIASVELSISGGSGLSRTRYNHHLKIEEFRTPEFQVATHLPDGPFVGSRAVDARVGASYYAGGPLPGAQVDWLVSAQPGQFRPPNRDDWQFGFQPSWPVPWMRSPESNGRQVEDYERFSGLTDATGNHHLTIDLDMEDQLRPLAMTARAQVMDVNRQAWTDASDFLVHPAAVYVGMKTDGYFVDPADGLEVEMITVDLDGEIAPGREVVVEAGRVRWHGRSGEEELADRQRCEVTSDEDGRARCQFETALGGQYRMTAIVTDGEDRANASRITRWVSGGRMPASDGVEMEDVLLIVENDEYAPGDTARVLVQAPFENAEGLMTLRRHGIAEQHRFRMDGATHTLEVPLKHEWMPGIEVHVTLVGQSAREEAEEGEAPRPAIATGSEMLAISTAERALDISLEPVARELEPGSETTVDLLVRNARGEPVADAEVALVVVDEAILALTGYEWIDPLGVFYPERSGEVSDYHLRPTIALTDPEEGMEKLESEMMVGMAADSMDRVTVTGSRMAGPVDEGQAIEVREDFNPLAAFLPGLVTDADGRVTGNFRLPDNLTRYRVMAVAVADTRYYGIAESAITARLPLMVRPSPPRFLNFGDMFEFPVVLQNQTDQVLGVQVAMEASNLELTEARGFGLEIPANDRVEVRFPARARQAGTARFQVAATTVDPGNGESGRADAARGELPVWTPATTEAFATYGVIDEGAIVQPVVAPTDVWPQFGQLEITTSSTAVQSLTDAFIYLHDYPFPGTAQAASRMLAVSALADVLREFGVSDLPEPEEIEASMKRDMELLAGRQNRDGGFALWRQGQESWPVVTLHVAHALVRAREKGFEVDEELYDSTMRHVVNIERHIPERYGDHARRHLVAYSLYVRGLTGDFDRSRARALIDEVDGLEDLTFESAGWLLGVLTGDEESADELGRIRRFLANRVTETAAAAHFVSEWQDDAHLILHSDRRADAIILEALMDDDPESDLIPKIVNGLQAHRTRGRWGNTQDNAFVLLALDKYFRRYESQEPDFLARAWLGEDFAGEHRFSGRTTDSHQIEIPMGWLVDRDGQQDLVLDKEGPGRMYYRAGLRYAPRDLNMEAASHGFEVQRTYRGADDESDVRQREDGTWEIRAGSRVEVELTLIAPTRRYHVALVDPLPAGLESLNPALAVTADDNNHTAGTRSWWWGPWYEHQNLRDERTEAFATLLRGGVHTYSYYARATTPGEFVVPPARAEEMYHPETFGRSASARVIVTDPSR